MIRLPIIVLGMHKSGTSLIAETLHRSGIEMVDQESSAGYDQGNHYERTSAGEINKQLLDCGGQSSLKIYTILELSTVASELYGSAEQFLLRATRNGKDWGFKDPRTCLTYAFWNKIIPEHRLICVYRDAAEVHEHYTRRFSIDLSRGYRALRAWHVYNTQMLAAFERTNVERRILLSYARLMDDQRELDRLSDFLSTPLVDARRPDLRRSRSVHTIGLRADQELLRMRTGRDVPELTSQLNWWLNETRSGTMRPNANHRTGNGLAGTTWVP